jgi:hypothetical protein
MASESDNDGSHNEVKRVAIRIFISHESAEIATANLEARGIACWINSDDGGGIMPYLTAPGGVRLLVRASDAEAAIALLNAEASPAEINQTETEAAISTPPKTASPKKVAWIQILLGVVLGVILCPLYQSNSQSGTKTIYHYTLEGKCDEARVYRDGNLVQFLADRNLDGAWDHWTYYEHGQVMRSEYDNNFDGELDETVTYSNGAPATMEKDTDFNGVPDWFCTYKYGRLQQTDMKPNGSKFTTTRELYQNGVLTEIWRGGDSDGHFKEVVRYDPFFNPISTNLPTTFKLLTPISN